ncbi:MAG: hypothetical protein R3F37_03470 [Candidatus Competibacteraceae bacterium]
MFVQARLRVRHYDCNDPFSSIGGERARLFVAHNNLTGWGDTLGGLRSQRTTSADDWYIFYTRPQCRDTTVTLWAEQGDSKVI